MMDDSPRRKILIVDDVPANIKLLGEALRADHDIFIATSGEKALEIALTQLPDLVLLDVMMPEMDGYEVCRRLKEDDRTKGIPVIFITAKDQSEDELRGLELGAVDYVTKPFYLPIAKARVNTQLRLRSKEELLERLANLDGLTEIPNRRSFDEYLDQEWRRAKRNETSLALILMDIDYFKKYNDNYGHGAGDTCLAQVAQALRGALYRAGDMVARYGGEEFVAVLPETNLEAAAAVAEKMRVAVAALSISHLFSEAGDIVSLSLGVADAVPAEGTSPEELLLAVDKNLYRAKESGRNRVVSG
jgi:diguanylate cyclase (GGDEF)-like protein